MIEILMITIQKTLAADDQEKVINLWVSVEFDITEERD